MDGSVAVAERSGIYFSSVFVFKIACFSIYLLGFPGTTMESLQL